MKQIFISYSHQDKAWLTRIKTALQQESLGIFQIWDDQELITGDKWLEKIEKALEAAQVAILLVTPDFLQSQFIREKEVFTILEKAKKEGLQIAWIAVEKADMKDCPLLQYQAANDSEHPLSKLSDTEMKQALDLIVANIRKMALAN